MLWFAFALVGSLALTGAAAVRAKQALIDDAQSGTEGYF